MLRRGFFLFVAAYLFFRRLLPILWTRRPTYVDGVPIRLPRNATAVHIILSIILYVYCANLRSTRGPNPALTLLWTLLVVGLLGYSDISIRSMSVRKSMLLTIPFMLLMPLPTPYQTETTILFLTATGILSLLIEVVGAPSHAGEAVPPDAYSYATT